MNRLNCIFPEAIKPWEKIVCGAVGAGAFIGSAGLASYLVITNIRKRETPIILTELVPKVLEPAFERISPKTRLGEVFFNSMLGTISLANNLFVMSLITNETRSFWGKVIGSTRCCNIIRSTVRTTGVLCGSSLFLIISTPCIYCGFNEAIKAWRSMKYEAKQ